MLDPWTVTIDLSKRFFVDSIPILYQNKKKVKDAPVLSRFGMWTDKEQNSIYIHSGHFYENPPWNKSEYFVPKEEIPPYEIWKHEVGTSDWTKVLSREDINRTLGGVAVSLPEYDESYYIGCVTCRSGSHAAV